MKIIKKELLQEDNGFLNIESFRCTLNNGKSMKREKILKGGLNKSACIVMPILDDAKTILVVQPRLSTSEGVSVELPAGYVEQNEKPVTTALRELREEKGLTQQALADELGIGIQSIRNYENKTSYKTNLQYNT